MLSTILIFIVVLGILVFVHEFGHFFVARRSGMKVDEFGFGFPPRMVGIQKIDGRWKFVWGHREPLDTEKTVYSINWIPFGGFVKIMGENNEQENDTRSFVNRPFWGRLATLVAGVAMNWILAIVLFSTVFFVGVTSEIDSENSAFANAHVTNKQVAISYIAPGLPAEQAGLQLGDIILSIDGQQFAEYSQVQEYIQANKGKEFQFKVKRINEEKDITVNSTAQPKEGEGPTGIALTNIGTVKLPILASIKLGFQKAWNVTQRIAGGLWGLLIDPWVRPFIVLIQKHHWVGFHAPKELSQIGGPVKIAQLTGQVAELGLVPLLNFTALLSINLAILNIAPFPALDGGRVLFLIIEKIRGKKNNQKIEQYFNTFGFVFLLMLMVVVTGKDLGIGKVFEKIFGG
jgi:regulator of sigma E protease